MKTILMAMAISMVAMDSLACAKDENLPQPTQTIALPGVEGRIDHLAVDVAGKRLFVAALGNNTLEVVDLAGGKRTQNIGGLKKPQGAAFIPAANRIVVASGDDGMCRFYDGASLKLLGEIKGLADADNVRYDAAADRIYVGYGEGALAVIDPGSFQKVSDIKLDGHPESFQLEQKGDRIFINVPDAKHIAVVDRKKMTVVAKWPVKEASANFPMALDEASGRLFVACRKPAKLLVFETGRGKTVAGVECAGDADDVFFDPASKRIYVSGGEGVVSVVGQTDADHYSVIGKVPTAAAARTALFVHEMNILCIAVPHRGKQGAEVRVFSTRAR